MKKVRIIIEGDEGEGMELTADELGAIVVSLSSRAGQLMQKIPGLDTDEELLDAAMAIKQRADQAHDIRARILSYAGGEK